jgi:Domain of unknown function (DUF6468)
VNHYLALFIESTVAVLLVITIGYCYVLDRRLKRFRADEIMLKKTIGELITATEIAERAIAGLKLTVRDCDQNLGERLRAAERFSVDIEQQVAAANAVLQRVSQIAAAGRPAQPTHTLPPAASPPHVPISNTQSTIAAAQALVDRARSRTGEIAA